MDKMICNYIKADTFFKEYLPLKESFTMKDLHKKNKVENRGGLRPGSGQKKKYGEETTTVAFRCPKSKIEELKAYIKAKLTEWTKDEIGTS